MRRVVVTGIGTVSAIGNNWGEFVQSLKSGRSGIGPMQQVTGTDLRILNGAEVHDFRPHERLDPKQADMLDRFSQFALVAAVEAVAQSGIEWTPELRENSAIVTGSCVGGQNAQEEGFVEIYKKGRTRVHPMTIPKTMANGGASAISQHFGITGASYTVSTACASSAHAMGQAFWMVRNGQCEAAITGGSEAPFSYGILKAWEAMRVVSPDVCRPFSRDRNGMTLGEGAAMVVLESLDHALARGAQPLAEVVGFGMSADAHHVTQPSDEGPARAIRLALRDAATQPEQIDYVNAHGTGTAVNDVTETRALKLAFGSHAARLAVSSTKSMHGHTLGAAGALEALAAIAGLRDGFVPPTISYREPDPECDLDCTPNQTRQKQLEYALSNSFAFGGLNAVLIFRRS